MWALHNTLRLIYVVAYISTPLHVYTNWVTHSSADTHLSCFCPLVLMNNAAIKTFMYTFLYRHMFSLILGSYLEVHLLSHMVILCLIV